MADVRPFRALRYSPNVDMASAICPPFDVISPHQQRLLHDRAHHNAVHIELADDSAGKRYRRAAAALARWRSDSVLQTDASPGFYLYQQQFAHAGTAYSRRALFALLRLEEWGRAVLPHEQTFGGPKEDRLKLLRLIRLNTSPIFLIYRDRDASIVDRLRIASTQRPTVEFSGDDGQRHTLHSLNSPDVTEALRLAFESETLYIADGHHRYETALAYRAQRRAEAAGWTGEEPENFVLVALAQARDPGLLVLPIHRVTSAGIEPGEALAKMAGLFAISDHTDDLAQFEFVSAGAGQARSLAIADPRAVDALLPQDRSAAWRSLDYAIANHVILGHCLGLTDAQMSDYGALWFTEDSEKAVADVQERRARYAVLMRPVPVERVLDIADSGERMPQKSTFFYPKLPTGLVFNSLESEPTIVPA